MLKNARLFVSPLFAIAVLGCSGGGGDDTGGGGGGDPPIGKGSGGTLILTNAPASTGGTFVSQAEGTGNVVMDPFLIGWVEGGPPVSNVIHAETLTLGYSSTAGSLYVTFHSQDMDISIPSTPSLVVFDWECGEDVDCSGVTLDQTAGSVLFSNTVLTGVAKFPGSVAAADITLNGTLKFTPASSGVTDSTPPTVLSVSPVNSAANVATSSVITATFSEPMLSSSITPSSFVVSGVTGTVSNNGNTAIFTPSGGLAAETTYNAMITTGVQDASGNALETDYLWTFTTGSVAAIPSIKGNNSALLSGTVIGSGTEAVGDLRKPLTVTVLGPLDTVLTVGTAYAMRNITSLDYAYIAMPVTNTGSTTLCLVKIDGLTYRDSYDVSLISTSTYVYGSIGKLSSGAYTGTCLTPGETGMMRDIRAGLYAAVEKMEFSFITSSVGEVSAPVASVIPQSYTVSANNLDITVKNVGSGKAQITGSAFWFLLDDVMQPLIWGTTSGATGVIPVAGTLTLSSLALYNGSGSKLLVLTDFADTALAANAVFTASAFSSSTVYECSTLLPTDEFALCVNESWNRRQEALELTIR